LGIPRKDLPGAILSPEEILRCSGLIQAAQDSSLVKIWRERLHWGIILNLVRLPAENASAQEIRTWMQEGTNQPLLQRITRQNWGSLQLTCVPEEIGLCIGLQEHLTLSSNNLVFLPERVFQSLTALQMLDLSSNGLVSLPEGVFQSLIALQTLFLYNNRLVSLPGGVFRGLTALQRLFLSSNHLTSLPEGVFRGLTALDTLFLSSNHLTSLPGGIFRGLTALRSLHLSNNHLASLPEEIFRGLTLQGLELYDNPQLMIFYTDLPRGNNRECLGMMQDFFNYTCVSQFATFYKLAAGNGPSGAVQASFSMLPAPIKNALYREIRVQAGRSVDDSEWSELHTFKDMPRFQQALKKHVKESFWHLSLDQQDGVYGHVYRLAQREDVVDRHVSNWGKVHAFDNILRFIDAMMLQLDFAATSASEDAGS
jgi:Leucine-rich repeat (LRR) protein